MFTNSHGSKDVHSQLITHGSKDVHSQLITHGSKDVHSQLIWSLEMNNLDTDE